MQQAKTYWLPASIDKPTDIKNETFYTVNDHKSCASYVKLENMPVFITVANVFLDTTLVFKIIFHRRQRLSTQWCM